MFLFEGLLKEVCDEGNSGELDGTMNGGKTRVERERKRKHKRVGIPRRCLQRRPLFWYIKGAVQLLNRVGTSQDLLVSTV